MTGNERKDNETTGNKRIYSEDYCHFDKLIWLIPGWSTAIFIGTAAVLSESSSYNTDETVLGFMPSSLITGFLFVIFFFLAVLNKSLYRFREHQMALKKSPHVNWWNSAQTNLQVYLTAQEFVVLYLALGSIAIIPIEVVIAVPVCAFSVLITYREVKLRCKAGPSFKDPKPS